MSKTVFTFKKKLNIWFIIYFTLYYSSIYWNEKERKKKENQIEYNYIFTASFYLNHFRFVNNDKLNCIFFLFFT